MIFRETPIFQKRVKKLEISQTSLASLRNELGQDPNKGDLIKGTSGLRKIRLKLPHAGKSSGARVIYYRVLEDMILFLFIYKKSEQSDLTPQQQAQLVLVAKSLEE